jgi:hypothetical protein
MSDDACSLCLKETLLWPKMRLLRSICGHRVCDTCVQAQFAKQLVLLCPVCKSQLRRAQFSDEGAGDALNKEISVRRKIEKEWNKRAEDFETLAAFNDYLEEREDLVYNLVNGIDVEAMQAKITAYRAQHRDLIARNDAKRAAEEHLLQEKIRIEEEQWLLRRQQFLRQDQRERLVKLRAEAEFLEGVAAGADLPELEARLAERRAEARAEAAQMLEQERAAAEKRKHDEAEAERVRKEKQRESEAAVLARKEESKQKKRVIGTNFNTANYIAPSSLLGGSSAALKATAASGDSSTRKSIDDDNDASDSSDSGPSTATTATRSMPAGERDPHGEQAIAAGGWLPRFHTDRIQHEAFHQLADLFAKTTFPA